MATLEPVYAVLVLPASSPLISGGMPCENSRTEIPGF